MVAGLQCLLGIVGYVLLARSDAWDAGRHSFWFAQLVVLFLTGVLLVLAGFKDRRALLLGTITILLATAFARTGVAHLEGGSAKYALRVISTLPLEAFFPYFFWRFARVFPEAFLRPTLDRAIEWAERASLYVGVFLIANNVALLMYPQVTLLSVFNASRPESLFHTLVYGLTFPILLVLWLRTTAAREEERRRVAIFIFGLLVTIVPVLIMILLFGISDEISKFLERDDIHSAHYPLLQTFIIATPIITAYAVLVERLLPVKLLLRQTFRFWLGNGFVVLGIALPLLLLSYYLYSSRNLSIAALFDGYNGLFIAIALGLSLFMLEQRHRAYRYLDNLFYRDDYNANAVLAALATRVQECTSLADVAQAMHSALANSLHPQSSHLLFVSDKQALGDPRQALAELPSKSALAHSLLTLQQPVNVRELNTAAGGAEERWLSQADASVLLPVKWKAANAGVLVLGNKRSELPYTRADFDFVQRVLATAIGPSAYLLDAWQTQARDQRAVQCDACGAVMAEPGRCAACRGSEFCEAVLPKVLQQQYEVSQLLGGGLGAVYLAQDLALQRPVVLKTVASASVQELHWLRDEARVMATVSHPHIAGIYGLESYQGMPILVCEYLPHGTLADILRDGYLARDEVLEIIEQMAQALVYLHGRSISHGDIKPSNIGFDANDAPKLLDFGLANRAPTSPGSTSGHSTRGGTYAYMSPEKIQGDACDQRADLWALAVTLCEALHGQNPFAADDLPGIIDKVTNAEGSIRGVVASPSPFLLAALGSDIARRPQTAEQFIAMMRAD